MLGPGEESPVAPALPPSQRDLGQFIRQTGRPPRAEFSCWVPLPSERRHWGLSKGLPSPNIPFF